MRDAQPQAEADEPGLLTSSLTTLRLIGGWAATALAALNLSMGIDLQEGSTDGSYLLFHVVLLLTGVVLLGWGYVRRVRGLGGALVGALVASLGLVLSTVPTTTDVCCLRDLPVRHGFPFTMIARGSGGWHADLVLVIANLLFWTCTGLLTLVAVSLARRVRARASRAGYVPAHAEQRATRTGAPQDENVGGLP